MRIFLFAGCMVVDLQASGSTLLSSGYASKLNIACSIEKTLFSNSYDVPDVHVLVRTSNVCLQVFTNRRELATVNTDHAELIDLVSFNPVGIKFWNKKTKYRNQTNLAQSSKVEESQSDDLCRKRLESRY